MRSVEIAPRAAALSSPPPRLAAIVLAAGCSRRMRRMESKMLLDFHGKPLMMHCIDAARAAGFVSIVVVTGSDRAAVTELVEYRGKVGMDQSARIELKHNPAYAAGMATSVIAGLEALHDSIEGAAILLGDMPLVTAGHLQRLVAAFNPCQGHGIVVPTRHGRWGNPLIWGREFFAEMKTLSGDRGAKEIAHSHENAVVEVEMPDDAVLFDVDTDHDLGQECDPRIIPSA